MWTFDGKSFTGLYAVPDTGLDRFNYKSKIQCPKCDHRSLMYPAYHMDLVQCRWGHVLTGWELFKRDDNGDRLCDSLNATSNIVTIVVPVVLIILLLIFTAVSVGTNG